MVALKPYLRRAGEGLVELRLDKISRLVGPLPASAHPAWWANEAEDGRHVHAWVNAGRQVESVQPGRRQVRFSAARWRRGS